MDLTHLDRSHLAGLISNICRQNDLGSALVSRDEDGKRFRVVLSPPECPWEQSEPFFILMVDVLTLPTRELALAIRALAEPVLEQCRARALRKSNPGYAFENAVRFAARKAGDADRD